MFPSNNSLFGGLAKVILTLVIIGVLVGLVLAGSDLTNFMTNSAKAQAIKQQNELQTQKDAIDVEAYRQSVAQQLLLQQEQAKQSMQFQTQKAAQDLETARLVNYTGTGVGVFFAFCTGIGLAVFMILVGRSRLVLAQAQVKQTEPWQDMDWRKERIRIFRERERRMRITFAKIASNPNEPAFYPDKTPIPWEGFQQQYAEIQRPLIVHKRKEER